MKIDGELDYWVWLERVERKWSHGKYGKTYWRYRPIGAGPKADQVCAEDYSSLPERDLSTSSSCPDALLDASTMTAAGDRLVAREGHVRFRVPTGLFRLWTAASLIWMLLIIAIAIGAKLHPEFRVSDRIKSVPLQETVDRERERQEAYKRGPLLENLKTGYEEAVRRGLVSPSNEAFVVHNDTGDILYRPAGTDNNWEPIVVAVVKNAREMFGLVSKKWKQISEQGRPGISRRIEDALRDTNNEWVLVNFPGEIGDVMFSPNFEALSRDERNTAGRGFFETLKPPIEKQGRSDLLNPRFWILLLGPPISVGVPMLLIAWIVRGFRSSETT
jgi:hypothetical protein